MKVLIVAAKLTKMLEMRKTKIFTLESILLCSFCPSPEEPAGQRPGKSVGPSPPLQGPCEDPQLGAQAGRLHDRQTSLRQASVGLQGQTGEIQQGGQRSVNLYR